MERKLLLIVCLVMFYGESMAALAAATFKTAEGQRIQVIIDTKVINAEPKTLVSIKGNGGLHNVKIKVYKGSDSFITIGQIRITPGYKNEFTVFINEDMNSEIKKTSATKIYNNQFKRPDNFYNRRFYTLLPDNRIGPKTPIYSSHDERIAINCERIREKWFAESYFG